MLRLFSGLAVAAFLAACSTTDGTQVAASGEDSTELAGLEPAAGTTGDPAAETEGATADTDGGAEVAALNTPQVDETPGVDEKAQTYLTCVVSRAAQEAQGGLADDAAVERGVDACRNQFRDARWAYLDTGVSESEADRYGVNLLTFVRDEAHSFLQSGT